MDTVKLHAILSLSLSLSLSLEAVTLARSLVNELLVPGFLPMFLRPALAGEGEWCEVAGAVVTGARELGASFKQGRAKSSRRGHNHSLSLSTFNKDI